MIQALLSSGHPDINITSLYTFLWSLWKARNDCLFNRKHSRPAQIFAVSNAIMQGTKLEGSDLPEDKQNLQQLNSLGPAVQTPSNLVGVTIFCDAAWNLQESAQMAQAGIGVFIKMEHNIHCKHLYISARSPPASSPLQAEAFGLWLATMLAEILQIQEPQFFTDSSILASAAAATNIITAPGHWIIRPLIAAIQESSSFQPSKIAHIHRSYNVKAHHQARVATRIQTNDLSFRCLCSDSNQCPIKGLFSVTSVAPFTLLSVKCA
jgi:hypothetical protein